MNKTFTFNGSSVIYYYLKKGAFIKKIKRQRMEEDVKDIKIKLKDMERHDVPSFPLDIVVFYLILSHTPNSTTLSLI